MYRFSFLQNVTDNCRRTRIPVMAGVCFFLATAGAAVAQDDVMYKSIGPGGPTYKQVVETGFSYIFPERLEFKGIGVRRDNVIAERIATNGRGGWWISVRARYSGNGPFGVGVAERATIHYDNGGVRLDIGGMKGIINTRGVDPWVRTNLRTAPTPPPPAVSPQTVATEMERVLGRINYEANNAFFGHWKNRYVDHAKNVSLDQLRTQIMRDHAQLAVPNMMRSILGNIDFEANNAFFGHWRNRYVDHARNVSYAELVEQIRRDHRR